MNGAPQMLAALAAGAALGALYLALLWAAVRALAGRRPLAGFLALAALRAALILGALAGAAALGAGAAEIAAALAGFVLVRLAATRRARAGTVGTARWK